MTIRGRVITTLGAPVAGASVSIPALDLSTRTGDDGRYAFLISALLVRGQAVGMTARHSRFGSHTAEIRIIGGSVVQDFVLAAVERPRAAGDSAQPVDARPKEPAQLHQFGAVRFADVAGSIDLTSALAGRIAGLQVTSPNAPGASGSMLYRGPRSLSATVQPLVVVDGVAMDNEGFATFAQRFGLGGFDYGSALQDVAMADIAEARLLTPLEATIRYGPRAANGILEVTTRNGTGITGLHLSLTSRMTRESPNTLPSYQNVYGQGLGGTYEFFNGEGGGINDAVAENWGPRLDARPIAQHSHSEPRRPEVRYWLPRANIGEDYFTGGHTIDIGAALSGSFRTTSLRAAVNARDVAGFTPNAMSRRLGLSFHGAAQPLSRVSVTANLQFIAGNAEHRPGTGFDEVNPIAGFTSLGRQVDLDSLRGNVVDDNSEQINWIYTDRNNPFFATSRNSNDDERRLVLAGARVGYALTPRVAASLYVGANDRTTTRRVTVDSGWKSGFPTTQGRLDFSGGGTDHQSVAARERFVRISVSGLRAEKGSLIFEAGGDVEHRSHEFETVSTVTDRTAQSVSSDATFRGSVTSMSLAASLAIGAGFAARFGARRAESRQLSDPTGSALYPSAEASYDFAARPGFLRDALGLGAARLRAGWWSAGNEITKRALLQVFNGVSLGVPDSGVSGVERTTGVELGMAIGALNDRFAFDVSAYRERSTDLLVATAQPSAVAVVQSGRMFNGGYAVGVRVDPIRTAVHGALDWSVAATFASNASTVDHLLDGSSRVAVAPMLFGASQVFQVGSPAGLIVGSRYLRDASSRALLLRNGLPIPDAAQPFSVLGSWEPDWTASFTSRLRYRGVELETLIDVRYGGDIFSATNLWGSYTGSLGSTLIGDRSASGDSLVIAGVDSVTGLPNATRASAEQYFHALGAIHEAWVYDASYAKLREARLTYEVPWHFLPGFREHRVHLSVFGRNLATWTRAANIDPETTLSAGSLLAFEMGQLPSSRVIGLALSIAP